MKQVIIVRKDIDMSIGKTAVQVAHASFSAIMKADSNDVARWYAENQKKIALKVPTLEKLVRIYDDAINNDLPASLIMDAGSTELKGGTITTVGIGPAADTLIDNITGNLRLL